MLPTADLQKSSIEPKQLASPSGPIVDSTRLASIDVARGIALLGIFFVNAVLFGEAFSDVMKPHAPVDEDLFSQAVYWFTAVFCNGKFYPLFSTLFGVGLAIMYQTSQAAGRPFGWIYFRRLVVLGIFGLLHIFLLWNGDVLLIYATIGLWMLWFGRWPARWLVITGFIVFGIGILLLSAVITLMVIFDDGQSKDVASRPMPTGDTRIEQFVSVLKDWNKGEMYDSRLRQLEQEIMTGGPFLSAAFVRVFHYLFSMPFLGLIMFWVVLPMFCWGAALLKLGFFHGKHRPWRRRFIWLGLLIGLPLNILAAIGAVIPDHPFWPFAAALGVNIGGPLMTLMYLSLILNWVDSGRGKSLAQALANVGRMALSAYLLESLLMSGVMLHWGLAQFGSTTWGERLWWLLGIYLMIVVFCNLWMKAFRIGPMEWLWRTLTYLRPQSLLR